MPRDAQVIIAGAGPVGLAAALELGLRGVEVLILDKQDRAGWHPRAKTTHVRTVEFFRRWGIAGRLRELAPLPPDHPPDIRFKTRLFGYDLACFKNAFFTSPKRDERYNEHAQWIPQYKVEQVLREKLSTLKNVSLRQGVEVLDVSQTGEGVQSPGVQVRARDLANALALEFQAEYLIGADGPGSTVRRSLGIAMQGERELGNFINIIFRCPQLGRMQPERKGFVYWIVNPASPGALGQMDVDDIWALITVLRPGEEKLDEPQIRRRIDAAVGRPVECELVATDYWTASRSSAESYGRGRIFLAGDSCHVHPPFGGYGMNMGIADAVDLGWKLAAVLQGWGGAALLAAYEDERRPVHEAVMNEAVQNLAVQSQHLLHDQLEMDSPEGAAVRRDMGAAILKQKAAEFHTLGIVLGVNYSGSPLVIPDGSSPPALSTLYTPSAHPGCLAPHLWLADGSSLYDHFGAGFTLLVMTSAPDDEDILQLQEAFADLHLPLRTIAPGNHRLAALYQAPLAIIRPDQHVAWRGEHFDGNARSIAASVAGHA